MTRVVSRDYVLKQKAYMLFYVVRVEICFIEYDGEID